MEPAVPKGFCCRLRIVVIAGKGSLATRRLLLSQIKDADMVTKLFDVLAARYAARPGGYIRVLKAGYRYGDHAPLAVIEFVDRDPEAKGKDSGPVQVEEEAA